MVVRVDGDEITRSQVDKARNVLLAQYRDQIPPGQLERAKEALWKRAMESLIDHRLLLQAAERADIQAADGVVDERLREIQGSFAEEEEFRGMLSTLEMSEEEFRRQVAEDVRIESLLDQDIGQVEEVSEQEVTAFYEKHPESFRSPELVRASHILVSCDRNAGDGVRAEKRDQAEKLAGRIDEGTAFERLASLHSDCPSGKKGGDLGYFPKGRMVPAFDAAAFGLPVGEVSPVVETEFGYHLIKVVDRKDPRTAPLEEIREQLTSLLNGQKREQAIGAYVGNLRAAATIEYAGD